MLSLTRSDEFISRYARVILIGILLVGLLIRLYGIDSGLPDLYTNGEERRVRIAVRMLASRDLNPHWFGHPATTVIYLLAGMYALIFAIGRGLGVFANAGDFKALYFQDPTIFYLSGRLMSTVFGVTSIWLVYLISQRLFDRKIALFAATLLAISPIHVYHSKLTRMDTLMPLLLLLAFWYCLKILDSNRLMDYSLAGFLTGLAIATKYPAVVFSVTIVLTYFVSFGWRSKGYLKPPLSAIACLVGVFLGSPFLFLDFQQVLLDVATEARPEHLSSTGTGFIQNLIWYLQNPFVRSFTSLGLVFIAIGCFVCLRSQKKESWILVSFPLVFLAFISCLNLRWDRWIVPIVPFICILLAYGIETALTWSEKPLKTKIGEKVKLIFVGIILAILLNASLLQGREMSGKETRVVAGEWMMDRIPMGSSILVERYTPKLPKEAFEFFQVSREKEGILIEIDPDKIQQHKFRPMDIGDIGELKDVREVQSKNIKYMVIGHLYDLYLEEREKYSEIVETYEKLMASGTLIYQIEKVPNVNLGPKIRIYKF